MSTITKLEIVPAAHRETADQLLATARVWLADRERAYERVRKFVATSRVRERYYCLPSREILELRGNAERARIFSEIAEEMAARAVRRVLGEEAEGYRGIDWLMFTSCTVPAIPTIDVQIMNKLPFSSSTRRLPVYQYGCAGGVSGLALIDRLAGSGRGLLLSTELCSLLFHRPGIDVHDLVGAAIFADGAACALVESDGGAGLEMVAARSYLIPGSAHIMGYDISDAGSHLRLHRELPELLAANVPDFVRDFLGRGGVAKEEVRFWLFHPGGTAILEGLEDVFSLERVRTRWAWDVLSRYGNMSSSSILFVLHEFMQSREYSDGDYALILGVGPGLTVELILTRCRRGS